MQRYNNSIVRKTKTVHVMELIYLNVSEQDFAPLSVSANAKFIELQTECSSLRRFKV